MEEYRTKQGREHTTLEGKERLETASAYALDEEKKRRVFTVYTALRGSKLLRQGASRPGSLIVL